MSRSRKLLLFGGLALALWGMSYGLWYALFDEHQTLEHMGGSLATGFAKAAARDMDGARASIDEFGAAKFEYVREVDVHSHWTGLAMLLLLLGVVFDRVGFDERKRFYLALMLLVGSVVFPLGVILQTAMRGAVSDGLAIIGSALVTFGLAGSALGFLRSRPA